MSHLLDGCLTSRFLCPYCNSATSGLHGNKNICGHCKKYVGDRFENEAIDAITTPSKKKQFVDILELPPRPFEVPIPAPARATEGKPLRAVVFGDSHIRYHDERAFAIAEAVIKREKPDILVHLGDLIDAGMISEKFPIDPRRLETLQDDIDLAKVKLHQWAQLAPQAERWLLEGNHEQRLTRLIWNLKGAARELPRLNIFQQYMSWPTFLGLDEIGWKWVSYDDQPRDDILPRLLVKHGEIVRKFGGWSAKGEWEKSGRSGVSGHTHRANIWRHKDYNGQATWTEAGCTCLSTTPGARNPDWQQAVTIYEWSEDRALMDVRQVLIRDGRAFYGGLELTA
jgi:Calcineurin-like phosphoesterase